MLRLAHTLRLMRDVLAWCWHNERVWPIPLVALLLLVGLLAFTTQVATPYLYTLF